MIDLSINPSEESFKIINFLKETLGKTPFKKVIVAVSGGVDSSTVISLAAKAIGAQNILVALLPYGNLDHEGLKKSQKVVGLLNIPSANIFSIDIKAAVDSAISHDSSMDNLRIGNVMARLRMVFLYDLAKKYEALVCGTENKTEYLLGYFTRFGDEASDIELIRHLYKTQVKKLALFLNIPEEIVNAPPTAGLWPGQTDEGDFGFTYEEADRILYLSIDKKMKKEELAKKGFNLQVIEKVLKRVGDNRFKHILPYRIG